MLLPSSLFHTLKVLETLGMPVSFFDLLVKKHYFPGTPSLSLPFFCIVLQAASASAESPPQLEYLGCFSDSAGNRLMPTNLGTSSTNTPHTCSQRCLEHHQGEEEHLNLPVTMQGNIMFLSAERRSLNCESCGGGGAVCPFISALLQYISALQIPLFRMRFLSLVFFSISAL